jgi:hypothetical protein
MIPVVPGSRRSTSAAALAGTAAGVGVLAVYLGAGLLFAEWSVGEFLSRPSLGTVASLGFTGGMVVASVALPVALYLRYRLLAPLSLLGLATVGWFAYGALSGVLTTETAFGVALYLFFFAPFLAALALVAAGGEYVARQRGSLR